MKVNRHFTMGIGVLAALLWVMSGCAAIHTSIAKKDLDVQTKMSENDFS